MGVSVYVVDVLDELLELVRYVGGPRMLPIMDTYDECKRGLYYLVVFQPLWCEGDVRECGRVAVIV